MNAELPPSPFSLHPAAVRCPAPFYAHLRHDAPVTWVEEIGAWVVSRYDDIKEIASQPTRFSNRYPTGPMLASTNRLAMERILSTPDPSAGLRAANERGRWRVLFNVDPPEHTRHRSLVNRAFTPREVGRREDEVRAIAVRLVEAFCDDGEVELLEAFAVPFPLEVIATRLGVPFADLDRFKQWSDDFTASIGNHALDEDELRRIMESQGHFYLYFGERITEARADPQDDMLGHIVSSELTGGGRLTDGEILGMLSQFLVAGNETTTNLLGSAALIVAAQPEIADELRKNPQRIAPFVEEVLRLEAPSQGMFRLTRERVVIGGVAIPAKAHLFLAYASANRDECVFSNPDEVDLDRTAATPHLAFGRGTHFCLGAPLARQEARVGLEVLLARCDDIRMADREAPAFHASYFLHGPTEVRLRFERRR